MNRKTKKHLIKNIKQRLLYGDKRRARQRLRWLNENSTDIQSISKARMLGVVGERIDTFKIIGSKKEDRKSQSSTFMVFDDIS